MITYIPRRELVEHAYYRMSRGQMLPGSWDTSSPKSWDPVWLATTDQQEGQRDGQGRWISTCAISVNTILRDCGCAEPWVFDRWIPGSPIRRWPSSIETPDPSVAQLWPGDVLVWRMHSRLAHTGFYLGPIDGDIVLTAEGGQGLGGRVKRRTLGSPDVAVPLDRLRWLDGEAPTVGQWLERQGFPPGECRAEEFLDADLLARMDAAR